MFPKEIWNCDNFATKGGGGCDGGYDGGSGTYFVINTGCSAIHTNPEQRIGSFECVRGHSCNHRMCAKPTQKDLKSF